MKDKRNKNAQRQVIVVSSGVPEDELQGVDNTQALNEFDVQKTAESANLYPAIAQGYPVSGFKDVTKKEYKE